MWQEWHFATFRRVLWRVENRLISGAALQTCRVAYFFANRIVRAASSGDKVEIPWQAWHFVRCAENLRNPCTKHQFWGGKFRGSKEISWENIDFEATKCQNWRKSRILMLSHVSSRVSGFPVALPCLWGKLQTLSSSKVPKQVVMSFCVAGAALCDIPTCLITRRKSFLCGKHSTPHSTLYTPRSTLHTPHSTLYTSHSKPYIPHSTLHTPHSTLYTLHFALYTLHSTLRTRHFKLHTLHFTLYTLHSPHYTLHSTVHTWHFTLNTLHFTLLTLDTLHSTL